MAKLRTFKSIENARYVIKLTVDQASISQTDRELAVKFGEPEIQVGGTFFGGATGTATVAGGAVTGITLTNSGNNYPSAPTITFGGPGTSAAATAVLENGRVVSVTITNGGSGYTTAPTVTFAATDLEIVLPEETVKIFSGLPYTRSLDSTVEPFLTNDPETLANGYKSEVQTRWTEAIEELRSKADTFTGEELTEV